MSLEKDIVDEFHKVEQEVENLVHHGEAIIEPQVESDVKDVEADAAGIEHDVVGDVEHVVTEVEADVKPIEADVKDAVEHPTDIPVDVTKVVTDVTADVSEIKSEVETDVAKEEPVVVADALTEEAKIAAQIKSDFAAFDSAGPGSTVDEKNTAEAWANRIPAPTHDQEVALHRV